MAVALEEIYRAVLNSEDQYSIRPGDRAIPAGWREAGFKGPRGKCLEFIKKTWVDQRPHSLREAYSGTASSKTKTGAKKKTSAKAKKKTTKKKRGKDAGSSS